MDEQVTHGIELKMNFRITIKYLLKPFRAKDVVVMQPLIRLNEVSGGTQHQNLRQCSGSASSKLPLLHSSSALVSVHQVQHGTLTDRNHMPAASHKWKKTIELCQSGNAQTEQRSKWLVAHPQ